MAAILLTGTLSTILLFIYVGSLRSFCVVSSIHIYATSYALFSTIYLSQFLIYLQVSAMFAYLAAYLLM